VSYHLPSASQYCRIETRQYELFGKPLGEGVKRVYVVMALLTVPPWFILMWTIGVPILTMIWAYVLPPIILVMVLTRPDRAGRYSYIAVYDRVLFVVRRFRPVIPRPGTGVTATPSRGYTLAPELHVITRRSA